MSALLEHSVGSFVTDNGARATLEWIMDDSSIIPRFPSRNYEYRRRMPHYQKPDRSIFVTFCKLIRDPFPDAARDLILSHCVYDHGRRIDLNAAVVMPDHVHLLLRPLTDETGWPYSLPFILKLIKGTSARSANKLMGMSGPVWQEESFDHVLRFGRKLPREVGVHSPESSETKPGGSAGGLSVVVGGT